MAETLYTSCMQCSAHFPYADGACPKCATPLPKEADCSICNQPGPRLELIPIHTRYLCPQHYHEQCLKTLYGGGSPTFKCKQCSQPMSLPTDDWPGFVYGLTRQGPRPKCEHCGCEHPANTKHCEACNLPIFVEHGAVSAGFKSDDDGEKTELFEHPECVPRHIALKQKAQAYQKKLEAERKAKIPAWQFWKS